jgi:hypothetical protein
MDTLAVQLTLPTTKRVRDFHPIAVNHASHTKKRALPPGSALNMKTKSICYAVSLLAILITLKERCY